MAQRYDKEQYENLKEQAMEKLVLHMRDPEKFGAPKLTLDEVAILQARTPDAVLSRMSVCKAEAAALLKLKTGLQKLGISSVADLIGPSIQGPSVTYGAV